jgi:hypothetical protein
MKHSIFFVLFVSLTFFVNAQTFKMVLDKEQIFKAEDLHRIDSMLLQFQQATGYYVLLATDKADVNAKEYMNPLFMNYFPDSTSTNAVLMLLMSRTHSSLSIRASKPLLQHLAQQNFMDMIGAGISALRDKRTVEGTTLILLKAMEYLNRLPVIKL